MPNRIKDLAGQRFGRLITVKLTDKRVNKHVVWECICDCGKTTYVTNGNLQNRSVISCGCFRRERARKLNWKDGKCYINGYIRIRQPKHPRASTNGYVLERRLVAEECLGRYLTKEEAVFENDTEHQKWHAAKL